MKWIDTLRARVRRWWKRNVADADPYEASLHALREALPKSSLFVVDGQLMDVEGLRVWAHWAMMPTKIRSQMWN